MPRAARTTTDHSHSDLEKEVAELRKEVAALKAQLAKRPARGSGGADPRISKIIEALSINPAMKRVLES